MKKILTNSGLPGLVNFHYTNTNSGEINIKKNVMNGDLIVVRNDVRNYKLTETRIEFNLNSKTEPTIDDITPFNNVISNTMCSDFSTYLYNNCNSSDTIPVIDIKWYLPENKIKKWWCSKMIKFGFTPNRDIYLIEKHIKDFFKEQPISNKRIIIVPFYIYRLLKQSISFSSAKAKNTDIYYGGKLGEISIWVNTYSISQSIYMANDHQFIAIANEGIDYTIVDDRDMYVDYNMEIVNQSDANQSMINLIDY